MIVPNSARTNARILHYPDKDVRQVATKPIFRRDECPPSPPQPRPISMRVQNPERSRFISKKRALSRFQKILDCNSFEYFVTLSFDGAKVDRFDSKAVYKKTKNFLDNARRKYGFSYLLIPGYHEPREDDKHCSIHLHALCRFGGLPVERSVYADGSPVSDDEGRPVFHLPTWKWGFSHVTPIKGSHGPAGAYCRKHIAECKSKIFGKWYLSSRDLVKGPAAETIEPIDYHEFRDWGKLKQKQQFEFEIYPGLSLLSEEFPYEKSDETTPVEVGK